MSDKFSVGEIAILHMPDRECHGDEALLYATYNGMRNDGRSGPMFLIEWRGKRQSDGLYAAFPDELRKKRPPEETTTWDSVEKICGWSPHSTKALEYIREFKKAREREKRKCTS